VVGNGFDGGLSALLKHFGGVEADEQPAEKPLQETVRDTVQNSHRNTHRIYSRIQRSNRHNSK
jgi:hypothetical protein